MPCEPKNRLNLFEILTYPIILLVTIAFLVTVVFGQAGQATRTAKSDPTGVACTSNSPILEYNNGQYTCVSSAYALTSVKKARYATASRPTCSSSNVGMPIELTDGNKGAQTCKNTTGSTYAWVDDRGGVIYASEFGLSTSNAGSANVTALRAALLEAATSTSSKIVEIEGGTFSFNDSVYLYSGVTLRGKGTEQTVLQYSKATDAFLRVADYSSAQGYVKVEDLSLLGTGAAVNVNTVGLDMSSMGNSVARRVSAVNFGTGILLDGYRSGSPVSTLYNALYDCEGGDSGAGRAYTSRWLAIQGGANSNLIVSPRTSYSQRPISIGDSSDAAPNDITIIDPVLELWDEYAIYIGKGFGITIRNGRLEGNNTKFKIDNSIVNVKGVLIDSVYIEGTGTFIDSTNPYIQLRSGTSNVTYDQAIGLNSPVDNQVENGGFEGWPPGASIPLLGWSNINGTNWAHGSTYYSRNTTVVTGAYSLTLGDGVNLNVGVASGTIAINSGYPYTVSWWSQGSSTLSGYRLALRLFDSAGAQITSGWSGELAIANSTMSYNGAYNAWLLGADITPTTINTWQRYTYAAQFPSTTKSVQIGFIRTATAAQTIILDDIQFGARVANTFIPKALPSSGDQVLRGTFTAEKLSLGNTSTGAALAILALGTAARIQNTAGDRTYYDAYNHVFRSDTGGTEFARIDQFGATTLTTASANALTVGANGATNPVLKVNAATASVATGIEITGAAAGSGATVAAISSGSNENLILTGKGTGGVAVGASGAAISTILSGTASLDFAQALATTCEELTITVTGAADGNPVQIGIPNALVNHNLTATFTAWVSAADTVKVRRCVISADGSDPTAATVRATVTKH